MEVMLKQGTILLCRVDLDADPSEKCNVAIKNLKVFAMQMETLRPGKN